MPKEAELESDARPSWWGRAKRWLTPRPSSPPSVALLADTPDALDEDVFGHTDYAAALASAASGAPNGVTFGLFGPWGIGKSSVLKALAKNLAPSTPVVVFDAWRYRDDAFRREFLRDVAGQLTEAKALRGFDADRDLRDLDLDIARPREIFAMTWRRFVVFAVACALLVIGFLAADGKVLDTAAGGLTLVAVLGLVTFAVARTDRLLELRTETESQKRLEDADRFSQRFRELLGCVKTDQLVVAIDNVDRLDAQAAVEVLSSVKTYLEPASARPRRRVWSAILGRNAPAPRVVFIVAVDDRAVRAYLRDTAPTDTDRGEYADEFLRKFFPVRVAVRPLLDEDFRSFIESHARALASRWVEQSAKWPAASLDTQVSELTELILAGVRANPRRVKHFINSMEMALTLIRARRSSGQITGPAPRLALLGQLLFIEEEFSERFEELVRDDQLLEDMHAAAQQGEVPLAWRSQTAAWNRMVPVLLSTYSVDRTGARTYLRLKIGASELDLPDRDEILAALRTGAIGDADERLDPQYLVDLDIAPEQTIEERAARAKPWALQLESLLLAELRSGRHDAAMNLMRAGLEIEVLAHHRTAMLRALTRAVADTSMRSGMWRLPPQQLLELARDLPEPRYSQLVNSLADAYARSVDLTLDRRRLLATELSGVANRIGSGVIAAIRAAIEEEPRASQFDYAPLVTARPELLSDAAVNAAFQSLDAAARASDGDDRTAPPSELRRFFGGDASRVLGAAAASGRIGIDDMSARQLAAAARAAGRSDLAADVFALIEHAVTHAPSVRGEGIDLLAQELETSLFRTGGAALLAAAALVKRDPERSSVQKLVSRVTTFNASQLAAAVMPVEASITGPMRAAVLHGLTRNRGDQPDALVDSALSHFDPEALANDADPGTVARALQDWLDADESHQQLVEISIGDAGFSDRQRVAIDSIAVKALQSLEAADEEDPDRYSAVAVFDVYGRMSEPRDEDNLAGHAEAEVELETRVVARLRRDADGAVDAQILEVSF
ncbi:KAP family NTPase [Solirubrobacter taibaiensis]|nr:KAP family NTPase [Solirubrobacter taibaiensis]